MIPCVIFGMIYYLLLVQSLCSLPTTEYRPGAVRIERKTCTFGSAFVSSGYQALSMAADFSPSSLFVFIESFIATNCSRPMRDGSGIAVLLCPIIACTATRSQPVSFGGAIILCGGGGGEWRGNAVNSRGGGGNRCSRGRRTCFCSLLSIVIG